MNQQATKQQLQEKVQQQLMHALLVSHYQEHKSDAEQQRINRVMDRINQLDSVNSQSMKLISFPQLKQLAVAASICFMVFMISLLILPQKSAMAEINQLIAELNDIGDRLYRISVKPLAKNSSNRININNQGAYKKSAAKWLDGASLYVRNQSDYLLMYETQHGSKLKASNKDGSWKLNEHKSLKEYADDKGSKLPLSGQAAEMALMDFPRLLNTLKRNYQLHYQAAETSNDLAQIIATRSSTEKGVKQVKIYYQPDTYLIEKMTFERVHLQGQAATYNIDLQLQKQLTLAPDFFNVLYHLSPQLTE